MSHPLGAALERAIDGLRRHRWLAASVLAILLVVAAVELQMGRLPFGPDGRRVRRDRRRLQSSRNE